MLPNEVRLFAPAKLTTSLRVVGVRPDGMHLIEAEMVTLDFGDDLHLAEGRGVTYRGAWEGEGGDGDLVTAALHLLGEERAVSVDKRIPAGAGLGGGSADAAAVLRAGGWEDLEAAASIGADVAFCLLGGRANVRGIGEIVEPLPYVAATYTLLTPDIHCSTPAVYRTWDELGGPRGSHGNDLEPAALVVAPELEQARDSLHEHTGRRPRLAGSGSTWFVDGAYPGDGFVVTTTIPAEAER